MLSGLTSGDPDQILSRSYGRPGSSYPDKMLPFIGDGKVYVPITPTPTDGETIGVGVKRGLVWKWEFIPSLVDLEIRRCIMLCEALVPLGDLPHGCREAWVAVIDRFRLLSVCGG